LETQLLHPLVRKHFCQARFGHLPHLLSFHVFFCLPLFCQLVGCNFLI
jgi:hypothetical protein